MSGFLSGNKTEINKTLLWEFVDEPGTVVKELDEESAELYAQIVDDLKKVGKPIPTNDMWIAAQTMELGAVLVTFDRHFLRVPGLRVWNQLSQN